MASSKKGASTAELTEAVCRIFGANPKNKCAIAISFATPADSISQPKEQIDHLKSKMNVVLKLKSKTFTVAS